MSIVTSVFNDLRFQVGLKPWKFGADPVLDNQQLWFFDGDISKATRTSEGVFDFNQALRSATCFLIWLISRLRTAWEQYCAYMNYLRFNVYNLGDVY